MLRSVSIVAALLLAGPSTDAADAKPPAKPAGAASNVDDLRAQAYAVTAISPIFSQLVAFSFPKGFTNVFEDAKPTGYLREAVLDGETPDQWTQMLTITGAKDLAKNPNVTPQLFADRMAGGFKNACPTSFSGALIGNLKFGDYDGFGAVVSCGSTDAKNATLHSEAALIIVIKGASDFYTLQWAERGASSAAPLKFDEAKWKPRFQQLMPIKLCPIVPGEAAPYPSCI
ncbi:MAG TPA: hypothetical protein VMH83_00425 [Candidatus Acidoferrum sp.]|nr:hypothetical protein [Candidatus Acidoferrum sp.]